MAGKKRRVGGGPSGVLPLRNETWAIGALEIADPEGIATAVMVLDADEGFILAMAVDEGPPDGACVQRVFEAACRKPAMGSPRKPGHIVIPDATLHDLSRERLARSGARVSTRPCPALELALASLDANLAATLEGPAPFFGTTREETRALVTACDRLLALERFEELGAHQALRVELVGEAEPGPYVVVHADAAMLLVLDSPADAAAAASALEGAEDDEDETPPFDAAASGLDIAFVEARELADDVRADLARKLGAIVGPDARVPSVARFELQKGPVPAASEHGIRAASVMAALADALPRLEVALETGSAARVEGRVELEGRDVRYAVEGPTSDSSIDDPFELEVAPSAQQEELDAWLGARFLGRRPPPVSGRALMHFFFAEVAEAERVEAIHPSRLDAFVGYLASLAPLTDDEALAVVRTIATFLDERLGGTLHRETCDAREERWRDVLCDVDAWEAAKLALLAQRVMHVPVPLETRFGEALSVAMQRLSGMLGERRSARAAKKGSSKKRKR